MTDLRKLSQFRLRTLLVVVTIVCLLVWWFQTRPRQYARQQTIAGRQKIHARDRTYLDFVFDQTVKDHLVTVIGDSRLTHWNSVAWIVCPNDDTIVSYGSDQALIVWNRDDGSIMRGFYDVVASAYAPGPATFFLVTSDGKLQSWSLDEESSTQEEAVLPQGDARSLACSPDGRFLAYGSESADGFTETVWDRETGGQTLQVYQRFTAVAFAPDSATVLLVDSDTINEYDTDSGELVSQQTIPPIGDKQTAAVYVAVFSQNGEHLYVGDASGRIFVYVWKEKRILREIQGCLAGIRDMEVDDRETKVLVASDSVRECYMEGNRPFRGQSIVTLHEMATAVCSDPHGIVACVRRGRLVEMRGGFPRRMVGGPRVDATCFAFSPHGEHIALAGRDGQLVIRETSQWERVQSWRAHEAWIRRLAWSPRGDILISIADDNLVAVWDPRTGDELCAFNVFTDPQRPIAFERDGKSFACYNVTSGFGIDIIDADTFEVICTIPTQSLYVRGNFILSQDARRLYAGGSKVTVSVWNLDDNAVERTFGARTVDDVKLALSSGEDVIFAADYRRGSAFEVATGKLLWNVPVHASNISDISLHRSGPLLATGGNDGMVTLVDTESGTVLKRLRLGPTRGDILQVDFSPDGQLLAVAMSNGAVVVMRAPWD